LAWIDSFRSSHVRFRRRICKEHIRTSDVEYQDGCRQLPGKHLCEPFRNTYYLDGILSYAYNKYDASRHIAFGNIDRVAKSDYAGHQYSAYVEGGYNFKKQGWNISPLVSLQYARLHLNKYSESDANSVNLDVDAQNYDMLQSGVGARFSYPLLYERSQIIPEVHVRWFYDFIGDRQQATATFTGAVLHSPRTDSTRRNRATMPGQGSHW